MFKKLRAAWRQLKQGDPGKRFQQFHESRKSMRAGGPWRFLFLAGGIAIVVVGLILLPAPGPGWLVIFLGGALLARESLEVARAMDTIEPWLRRIIPGGRKVKRRG